MASLSSTHILPLSPISIPKKPISSRFLFRSQNPKTLSTSVTFTNSKPNASSSSSSSSSVSIELNASTLREICQAHVPEHVLRRVEEVGYVRPTDVQKQALPLLFSGRDCILHAQVTRVARMLAARPMELELEQKSCTVMALLDGGMLKRHKSWLKADPPTIVVATIKSLCQMLEKKILKLESMKVLIIDEVDFMFNSSKEVSSLRKLLTSYSSLHNRQTIFASASIPQHNRFVHDCIQQKWTKRDVVHVHVNPIQPMPSCLHHRFVICGKNKRHQTLLSLLQSDAPESGIIFVGEQSEKSKKAGNAPPTTSLVDFLRTSYVGCSDIHLLEEDMNFNSRAASLSEVRQGGSYLLVATDIAARGVDLPETTHIYNFDLPRTAVDYLHRAGRTGRKPFSDNRCTVTNVLMSEERFVLQRFENELLFNCEELIL
ncbi:DEAD-box ATP-dependent RNA helicase 58, chloroplastic isoform X2 [Castanea sativa]|uniref:DEAD-box ATP-dependent RNA helicase 58, chloroplastic isoform X2 n=1 Tax=Castanea sativa TaxID=21020 RepID=UPI003F653BAC